MNKHLQNSLLWLYRQVTRTGLMQWSPVRETFHFAYGLYKQQFEAGPIAELRSYVLPNTAVLDIGANVGFFTTRFARWLDVSDGKVIAFEPEAENFQRLLANLSRLDLAANRVEALQCAVADQAGILCLAVNPYHPGDHKLDAEGIPVEVVTIDGILEARGWPTVSLIKIDVQGAEARVIQGSCKTLEKFHPALFIEVDKSNLAGYGTSPEGLLEDLGKLGYQPYRLRKHQPPEQVSQNQAIAIVQKSQYADFLFLASRQG